MSPFKKRSGLKLKRLLAPRLLAPARKLVNTVTRAVAARQAAEAASEAEAERVMKAAVTKALNAVTPQEIAAISANPTR